MAAAGGERSHLVVRYQLREWKVAVTEQLDETEQRMGRRGRPSLRSRREMTKQGSPRGRRSEVLPTVADAKRSRAKAGVEAKRCDREQKITQAEQRDRGKSPLSQRQDKGGGRRRSAAH